METSKNSIKKTFKPNYEKKAEINNEVNQMRQRKNTFMRRWQLQAILFWFIDRLFNSKENSSRQKLVQFVKL